MPITSREANAIVSTAACGERFDIALIERLLPQLAWIAKNSIAQQWQAKVAVSDILQDTFMEAAQTLPAFSGSTIEEFNQWLRVILTNNVRDARRKYVVAQKRSVSREHSLNHLPPSTLTSADISPSHVAELNEFDHELQQVIQCLDSIDRFILTLRYQEKSTFAEIGKRLNMKEDTVRKRWRSVLSTLQRLLESFDSRTTTRRP